MIACSDALVLLHEGIWTFTFPSAYTGHQCSLPKKQGERKSLGTFNRYQPFTSKEIWGGPNSVIKGRKKNFSITFFVSSQAALHSSAHRNFYMALCFPQFTRRSTDWMVIGFHGKKGYYKSHKWKKQHWKPVSLRMLQSSCYNFQHSHNYLRRENITH